MSFKRIYFKTLQLYLTIISCAIFFVNSGNSQESPCQSLLKPYNNFKASDNTEWNLEFYNDSIKMFHYYGAIHSKDTTDQQFEEIEKIYNELKPNVVLYEGPDRGVLETKNKTILLLGESGFLRFIVKDDNVLAHSLEPNPIDEILYLNQFYSAEKIKLFFLLREAQRVRETLNFTQNEIESHISNLLIRANSIPIMDNTILTIRELEMHYKKYWGNNSEWWQAPKKWFDPLKSSEATGGIFTNDINRKSSQFRDLHMYELIKEHLIQDKKILAVVGRNHIPVQADALKCEFAKLTLLLKRKKN